MSEHTPTLHMVCGQIAAGKSTLTERLGQAPATVVISEDAWLGTLYGEQMSTLKDYVHFSTKLKAAMGPHIVTLLRAGTSVVLDYQANTIEARSWMRRLFEDAGAAHCLHFLDVPDAVRLDRLHKRNAEGTHPFKVSDEHFWQLSKYFVPPTEDEGFRIEVHRFDP